MDFWVERAIWVLCSFYSWGSYSWNWWNCSHCHCNRFFFFFCLVMVLSVWLTRKKEGKMFILFKKKRKWDYGLLTSLLIAAPMDATLWSSVWHLIKQRPEFFDIQDAKFFSLMILFYLYFLFILAFYWLKFWRFKWFLYYYPLDVETTFLGTIIFLYFFYLYNLFRILYIFLRPVFAFLLSVDNRLCRIQIHVKYELFSNRREEKNYSINCIFILSVGVSCFNCWINFSTVRNNRVMNF